jgi:teichuronic acid biosynthesis glycosyltransferase TuaC
VSGASAVLAVSRALADRVEAITGVPAIHLPLGSDHRSLAAAARPRGEARDNLRLQRDRIVVLFVGNLKSSKGVHEAADAILRLGRPFLGVFVGDGSEAGYGMDDPRAAGLLEYRGATPHERVIEYMCAADVLLLPSYGEGLPTVIVEAGSLGLPVIASRVGGIPELLDADRGALLQEISPDAIAAALTAFADDPESARVASRRLHALVVDRYDVDLNATRLLSIYRSIETGAPVSDPSAQGPG